MGSLNENGVAGCGSLKWPPEKVSGRSADTDRADFNC
jgi:hypothetical protein